MRSRTLPLLVALAVAAGCGGAPEQSPDAGIEPPVDAGLDAGVPDAGPPDAGEQPVDAGPVDAGIAPFPVEQWCELYTLAVCARDQRCLLLDGENVDACRVRESARCAQEELTAGVGASRLQYDPQLAADCINGFAHGACTEAPPVCAAAFVGTVPAQGECLLPNECQAGSYCNAFSNTCPFQCHTYQPVGATCNWSDRQCEPAVANCRSSGSTSTCVARKGAGGSCQFWSDCFDDFACIDGACVQYVAQLGEACAHTSGYPGCEPDAFCRLPLGKEEGPGVCMRKAGLGGVCSGYGSCLPGLRCSSNYSTGHCVPLGSEGDICWNYNDCREELYCANATSRCTPLPVESANCGSDTSGYRCAAGFFCEYQDETCYALRAIGEACGYDDACQSGECNFGPVDGGTGWRCEDACVRRLDGGM
jgi:hypothetical protein